jgi:signal transduction histidine kinase
VKFKPKNFIRIIAVCVLLSCCAIILRKALKKPAGPGGKQINLMLLTNKISITGDRHNVLPYIDSVYKAQKNKTPYLQAGRLMCYADNYYKTGLYHQAIPFANAAIAIINNQNLSDSTWSNYYISVHIIKGNTFFSLNNYPLAIDSYFKAKEVADKLDNKCGAPPVNHYIALILYKQQKYEQAKKYFRQTYQQLINCTNDSYTAGEKQELLNDIAYCYTKLGVQDSALMYCRRALLVTQTQPSQFSTDPILNVVFRETAKGVIMGTIAQIFVKQNKLDSAEILFKKNIAINGTAFKAENRDAQLSQLYLAELYDSRKQYAKMKLMLTDLRKSLDTLYNEDAELGWRKLMATYASSNNLPLQAAKYNKSYVSMRDSLNNAQKTSNESDIARELKDKSQQLQISLLQRDNQLNRLYLWITMGLSVMALIIVALFFYYYKKSRQNIQTLTMLNKEIGEKNNKLEYAMVELGKSNSDKERILKVVAHDLRNPIGGIAGLTRMLIEEKEHTDDEVETLKLIEHTSVTSLNLINELLELDLSPQNINLFKQDTDINETVKQCVELMHLNAEKKNQQFQLLLLPNPVSINIDKEKIERVLNNLLSNAIKFSDVRSIIAVKVAKTKSSILISVKDEGMGISPGKQSEIFDIFSTARRPGTAGEKSFGLGLSICKQIVEAHNGKIWVKSDLGKGTVFYVELLL